MCLLVEEVDVDDSSSTSSSSGNGSSDGSGEPSSSGRVVATATLSMMQVGLKCLCRGLVGCRRILRHSAVHVDGVSARAVRTAACLASMSSV